jgi:hypothetical protein
MLRRAWQPLKKWELNEAELATAITAVNSAQDASIFEVPPHQVRENRI